jgi:aspartate/methionine/tyrosine aminotransferase
VSRTLYHVGGTLYVLLMPFTPFALERWQSTWEHRVRRNLSESGVHALTVAELLALTGGDPDRLAAIRLGYDQSDGSEELRAAIAAHYPGAGPDHVTVAIGSAEANYVVCWALIRPADRVAVLAPTYMQMWGLAQSFGATVVPFSLDPRRGWDLDRASLEQAVTPGTRVVIVTDPNNPTGRVLTPEARAAIVARARAVGAWLVVDEVFQGAELDGRTTPTWWGAGERVVVVNGLSKAYGLPGLRIGWVVSSAEFKQSVLERHDYTVIGPSPLTDYLALLAVRSRDRLWARTRDILNANYPVLERWLGGFDGFFDWRKPDCGAICFARYRHSLPAPALAERARAAVNVLLVPGEHFGLPGHLRIGYGNRPEDLRGALEELTPFVEGLTGGREDGRTRGRD